MSVLKRIKKSVIEIIVALVAFFIMLGIFSYFAGLFNPITVNKYILTNGTKTVVFQEMRHVGTGDFYKRIDNDIRYYRKQGYVFGYEGIFFLGGREVFMHEIVDYNQAYMEQPISLGGIYKDDINLDLNWLDISNKIETKMNIENKINDSNSTYAKQTLSDIPMIKNEQAMQDAGIDLVEYTIKNIIRIRYFENLANKYNFDLQKIMYPDHPIEKSVIIDERNKIVADFITHEHHDKILINYGAEHFDGIFKLMQESDKKWKIVRFESIDVL